jgi:olfactory receptor
MLNPFIYSLRNRDMKRTLRNILSRTKWCTLCFLLPS